MSKLSAAQYLIYFVCVFMLLLQELHVVYDSTVKSDENMNDDEYFHDFA